MEPSIRIPRCYDSHLHLLGTGEACHRVDLAEVQSWADVFLRLGELTPNQQNWLVAYGLPPFFKDQNPLQISQFPKSLNSIPVLILGQDSHSGVINGCAAREIGAPQPGWIGDRELTTIWPQIAISDPASIRQNLILAQEKLNSNGFTHVRDMSTSFSQWNEMVRLDLAGEWSLFVESYFIADSLPALAELLPRVLDLSQGKGSDQAPHLKAMGIKFFLDGALGSEGAHLHENYCGQSHRGQAHWNAPDFRLAIQDCWKAGLEIAVHAIGDAAADLAVETVAEVLAQKGPRGLFHLEHGELMQPGTIERLMSLPVQVHQQPSHFLSDQTWAREKLGKRVENLFPWRKLERAEVPFYFGSDSPVATANLALTQQGLNQAADFGIPNLKGPWWHHHSHPNPKWGENSWTEYNSQTGAVEACVFEGRSLL